MRIGSEALPRQLTAGLAALYTVYGAEALLALEAQDRIRAAARNAGYAEREVLTVEPGFDWGQLTAAARSLSLFAARKIVELRMPTGKPGAEGAAALQRYCAALWAGTLTIIALPKLDRAQLASDWFTALDANGVVVAANEVTREALPRWMSARLALQGQSADAQTLKFLTDRLEGNLFAAYQEVQKLALLFPPGPLPAAAVQEAVQDLARFDVFKLSEALVGVDAQRLLRMLQGLKSEDDKQTPLVLWVMTEEIRALAKIKQGLARGGNLAQLMRDNRVWGPRQRPVERAVQRLGLDELTAALEHAASCDRLIKGVEPGDAWVELERLGLRLMPSVPAGGGG